MNPLTERILWGAALVAVIAGVLLGFIARTVSFLSCGTATISGSFVSGFEIVFGGDTTAITTPPGCAVPVTGIRVATLITVLVLVGLAGWVTVLWWRWRQSDAYFIREMRGRAGFAKRAEVSKATSARAVLKRAGTLRPGLKNPTPEHVGWPIGRAFGKTVYVSVEDSLVVEGPPRSGKGYRLLIGAILDWCGPLITTSTRADNLTATMKERQRRGEVTVFDPQGLSGVGSRMKVSPIAGCEDPLTATQRAQAIVHSTALGSSANNGEWAEQAATILAQLLHAAAVDGRGVDDLYSWGANPTAARRAVEVLRLHGSPGWADALDGVLSADPRSVSSSWFGVKAAVAPLAIPTIREALSPQRGETFEAEKFLTGENTLYLIGTGAGAGAAGGFLGALLDDIVDTARRKALASPGSRLAMPLGLVLDEIVNMFAWAALPQLMADGGGIGISPLVVVQGISQAVTAWSQAEADTLWSAATAKILLGGASDVSHLADIERMLGTRRVDRRSTSSSDTGNSSSIQSEQVPVMTLDEIRRMPAQMGLLTYKNKRGILLDLAGWTERADAKNIGRSRDSTEQDQQDTFRQQYEDKSAKQGR